jgi:hypothetical protein
VLSFQRSTKICLTSSVKRQLFVVHLRQFCVVPHTDGKYEPLAYRQEVVSADGRRETLISSGGSVYKLTSKTADWKAGADAMTASGAAVRMAAPAAAPAAFASASMMSKGRMMHAYSAPKAAMEETSIGGASYGGMATDRKDNNLADLVLQATKEAASKKLNVEFQAK